MPARRTASIVLPPALLREVERLARRRRCTVVEVISAAIRGHLEREEAWRSTLAYGKKKAKAQGIRSETDIARIVTEFRREQLAPQARVRTKRGRLMADPAEAFRRSAGGWKGLIDAEKLIRDIYRSRLGPGPHRRRSRRRTRPCERVG